MGIELLCVIGIVLLFVLSEGVIMSVYKQYSKTSSRLEYTGRDVAAKMLENAGINNVSFGTTRGELSDYYNSKSKTIYFSQKSATTNSVAAIAVAAHETGHAIQDAEGYFALKVRHFLAPVCWLSSRLFWIAIIIGVLFQAVGLVFVGLGLMLVSVLFQLVTLPVEFDASRRAVSFLRTAGYEESVVVDAQKVLKAAAFTYVASAMASILELIRIFARVSRD